MSVAGFTGRTWLTASLRSALFGRAAVVALVAAGAIEWLLQDEDHIQITTIDPSEDSGLAGYYWGYGGRYASTSTELANAICSAYQYCDHFVIQSYNPDPSRQDLRTVRYYLDAAGKVNGHTTRITNLHVVEIVRSLLACLIMYLVVHQ